MNANKMPPFLRLSIVCLALSYWCQASAATDLLGSTSTEEALLTIDKDSGTGTLVGLLGFGSMRGLAYDSLAGVLYGVDDDVDQLVQINPETGVGTTIGGLGLFAVNGLAYDSSSDTLFGVDSGVDKLVTINRITGEATAVGSLGIYHAVRGLAFDSSTNTLYGSNVNTDELIVINRSTGAGTLVGSLGFNLVDGLAYDASTDTLFGTDINSNQLITINRSTGAGTVVGPLVIPGVVGLTSAPAASSVPTAVDIDVDGWVWHLNGYHTEHAKDLHPQHPNDPVEVSVFGSLMSVGDPVDFDTDDIDPATLRFGPAEAAIDPASTPAFNQTLDADGIDDALFEFLNSDIGLDPACADTELTLTGVTTGGEPFEGTDADISCNASQGCHG